MKMLNISEIDFIPLILVKQLINKDEITLYKKKLLKLEVGFKNLIKWN